MHEEIQLHPLRILMPSIWQQIILRRRNSMEKESDLHEALDTFVKYYGAPDSTIYYVAQEQVGPGTKFQSNLIK